VARIPPTSTLDLDPDNEFSGARPCRDRPEAVQDLVAGRTPARSLSDTTCAGSPPAGGTIRQLLQAGELKYNPDARVLNYSMELPRTRSLRMNRSRSTASVTLFGS